MSQLAVPGGLVIASVISINLTLAFMVGSCSSPFLRTDIVNVEQFTTMASLLLILQEWREGLYL